MGLCGSADADKEDRAKNKHVEKLLLAARKADYDVIKLLLLGAGESGKSTLFKQMVTIYGKKGPGGGEGLAEDERRTYTDTIRRNVLQAMKTLCIQSEILGQQRIVDSKVQMELEPSKKWVMDCEEEKVLLTPDVAEHLHALWHDQCIRETFRKRSHFQLADNFNFFFDRVKDIAAPDYLPTQDDVLRCRIRTTGIVEEDFEIENNTFRFVDVGGQRNERKKWIHCFEHVTAILFVVSLSAYDQVLFEDEETNRLDEALTLFDDMCNDKFPKTPFVLFLNKKDLFEDKIVETPLTVWTEKTSTQLMHQFEGNPRDQEHCKAYIRNEFVDRNQTSKTIYPHMTCATDTDQMRLIFDAVKDIVIRESLQEGGLLSS